jgi:hypothetical protein
MALLVKDQINQFGVQEEYWRILKINLDLRYRFCDITVGSYYDKNTREAGSEPMNVKKIRAKWSDDEFNKYFSPEAMESNNENKNIYQIAYNYIKEKEDIFVNALNC